MWWNVLEMWDQNRLIAVKPMIALKSLKGNMERKIIQKKIIIKIRVSLIFGTVCPNHTIQIFLKICSITPCNKNAKLYLSHYTTVRLCSVGVTKLIPKGFDRQNSLFLHPHGTLVQNEIISFRKYFHAFMTTRKTDWHIKR